MAMLNYMIGWWWWWKLAWNGLGGHSLPHRTRRRRSLPTGDSQLALNERGSSLEGLGAHRHCAGRTT